MPKNLKVLKTKEEIISLTEYLRDKDIVAYDVESTGLTRDASIIGYSVCAELNEAFYVIRAYWSVEEQKLKYYDTDSYSKDLLNLLSTKRIVGHNVNFDVFQTRNSFNVDLLPSVFADTMILAHLLNENQHCGLKELAVSIFGENSKDEQTAMKESVIKNGGVLNKTLYELYKADADLIGLYGAQDAELTLRLFWHLIPQLYEQKLDQFYFEDESMPLLKTATYDLNYGGGLRVDQQALSKLKSELETEILEHKAFIYREIDAFVKADYPATSAAKTFNIDSPQQIAWLSFIKLGNPFGLLTDGGRELCKALDLKIPYTYAAKREFIRIINEYKGRIYEEAKLNAKTGKMSKPKKVSDSWKYLKADKESLAPLAKKYKWAEKFLEYKKAEKMLGTYVEGIQDKLRYGIIHPSFLQHGTTSGRYSSKEPNFQNLPKNDKRIKKCIVSRPGKVFVGADQSQIEARCFASASQDHALMSCFERGEDFYSVVGSGIFDKYDCTMFKDDENGFAKKYPALREVSKAFALASVYGTSGFQQSLKLGKSSEECDEIIRKYFDAYPNVEKMMLESHEQAMTTGVVYNLFGRPRRIPEAMEIRKIYGNTEHHKLPYKARSFKNLSVNHKIQSTAASIMNRCTIAVCKDLKRRAKEDIRWSTARLVLQVHDSLIIEAEESIATEVRQMLRHHLENTVLLPGVRLEAKPLIGTTLSDV